MDMIERIIDLSKRNGITGTELGKKLGLQKSPLTDWKNNKAKPTVNQLIALCEIFATNSDYILFGVEPLINGIELDGMDFELLSTYHSLDNRGQHKVHTVIYEELDRMDNTSKTVPKNKQDAG